MIFLVYEGSKLLGKVDLPIRNDRLHPPIEPTINPVVDSSWPPHGWSTTLHVRKISARSEELAVYEYCLPRNQRNAEIEVHYLSLEKTDSKP